MQRTFVVLASLLVAKALATEIPCTYKDHLRTDEDWHGFLANITIVHSGRMTFEFRYPMDLCCQKVLFYTEDQLADVSPRMDCWQKEDPLDRGSDQILRLTPRFTWSGCHRTFNSAGVGYYECVGGRSFVAPTNRPTTWYIAVSNCEGFSKGIDLEYTMQVHGHVGSCTPGYRVLDTPRPSIQDEPRVQDESPAAVSGDEEKEDNKCVIEGSLNTTVKWFGFIANLSLTEGGKFRYQVSFPRTMHSHNILIYNSTDINKLQDGQQCYDKEGILRNHWGQSRILELGFKSGWNGCVLRNNSKGLQDVVCEGLRKYKHPVQLFLAVNNCWSSLGLALKYKFEIDGFEEGTCPSSSHCPSPSFLVFLLCLLNAIVFRIPILDREEVR